MAKPRFEIIKSHILKKIASGGWRQGDAVPSENQLAEKYGVSRMTARRALSDLTSSGVLERIQGSGTFVAKQLPTGSLLEIRNIADEIKDRGHTHRSEIICLQQRKIGKYTKPLLALEAGDIYFFSRILHFENEIPIQLEERYVNSLLVPDYLSQDFSRQTPSAYLTKITPLSEADHWVEAIKCCSEVCTLLQMKSLEPCLKISRRTYTRRKSSRQLHIVNFAHLYHPGSRYRLGGHLNF